MIEHFERQDAPQGRQKGSKGKEGMESLTLEPLERFKEELKTVAADKTRAHFVGIELDYNAIPLEYATMRDLIADRAITVEQYTDWRDKQSKREDLSSQDKKILEYLNNKAVGLP